MTNFEARVQKRDGIQDFIHDRSVTRQSFDLPIKLHPQPYTGPSIRHSIDLGTCCETSHAPGCSAKSVEECVCKHDNYCCQGKWDLTCIRLVKSKKCSFRKAPCPAILGATDEEVVEEEVDSKPKASEESDSGEGSGSDGSSPPVKKPPKVYCRDSTTNKRVPCTFIFNHIARNHKIAMDTAKLKRVENMEKRGQHIPEGMEKPVLPLKFKDTHQNITTVNHIRYDQDGKTTIKGSIHYGNPSKMYENTYDGLNTNDSKSTYGQGCCYSHEEPGCEVPQIQDCVCAVDDSCCSSTWDDHCVKQLVKMNCGKCSAKDRVPPPPRVKNETEADGVMSDAVEKPLAKENSTKPGDSDAEPDEDWKFKRQSHWTQVEFTGDPGRLAKIVKEGVKRFGRANPMGQWGGNRIPEPNPEGPGAKPAYPYSSPEDIARMKRAAFAAKSRTWFDGQGVEAA